MLLCLVLLFGAVPGAAFAGDAATTHALAAGGSPAGGGAASVADGLAADGSPAGGGAAAGGDVASASAMSGAVEPGVALQTAGYVGWEDVSDSGRHSLALKSDGSLWAWGNNGYGQLGDGTKTDKNIPIRIGMDNDWVAISTGDYHSLAVKGDGSLWAWGQNTYGQLGNGTMTNRYVPTRVGTDNDWQAVSAGDYHSLALKGDGSLWAWGWNDCSQLGDNTTADKDAPTRVGTDNDWQAVSAGDYHSLALKGDGSLWAWGDNTHGQLGDGTTVGKGVPVRIGADADWRDVSVGYHYSLALKEDGSLWVWGWNTYGQLGDGTTTNRHVPTRIGVGADWQNVNAGTYHSLAIKDDGSLWTWGLNWYGQIGDDTTRDKYAPTRIGAGTNWRAVGSGEYHSLAIKDDGSLWAWGWNAYGQLGDGTTTSRHAPIFIKDPAPFVGWKDVSAGRDHSLAIKNDGSLWAWGWNLAGQLGDGASGLYERKVTPVRIGNENDWKSVSAGQWHSLAMKDDGSLWSWGCNDSGQLGDGTSVDKSIPARVGIDNDWIAISTGDYHSLAIKDDGSLWAWGNNYGGQLGNGTTEYKNVPTRIGADTDWAIVDAGGLNSLAIKKDGSLWSWGRNNGGQVGDGTTKDKNVPTRIGDDISWTAISSGGMHSFATKDDGSLWGWGWNYHGQLGDGTAERKDTPTRIGINADWAAISAGGDHSLALKDDGSLWGWGRATPTRIGTDIDWKAVSVKQSHSLAIKDDGSLWAWGDNYDGQVGDGTRVYRGGPILIDGPPPDMVAPVSVSDALASYAESATVVITATDPGSVGQAISGVKEITYTINGGEPVTVPGDTAAVTIPDLGSYILEFWATDVAGNEEFPHNTVAFTVDPAEPIVGWKDVSARGWHVLAVKHDGTLWAWGQNGAGYLGDGTTEGKNTPTRIGSDTDWETVSAGSSHSLAIKNDGSLWAWGSNWDGQLGDGTTTSRYVPTRIGADTDWKAICAGDYHSLAIKSDGTLWAWGNNECGQLGDGTSGASAKKIIPTRVGADSDWETASAGSLYTLAIKSDGSLWAWGINDRGQLGDGTTTQKGTPTRIGSDVGWVAVAAGGTGSSDSHSLAVKDDGTLWAWGANTYGQLGDGTATRRYAPVRIGTDAGWKAVSAGTSHSLALKDDGSLWAWGVNSWGQIGIGVSSSVPARVGSGTDWEAISAGRGYSQAIKNDGSRWAWGWNYLGLLGDGTSGSGADKDVPTLIDGPAPDTTPPVSASDALASYAESAVIVITATDAGPAGATVSGVASITYTINGGTPVTVSGDTAAVTIPDPGSYILEFWATDVAGNKEFPHNAVMFTVEPAFQPFVGWKAVSVGGYYSLGIKDDGSLWAWGINDCGQLGDGTSVSRNVPVRIGTDADWKTVSAGSRHSLAIKDDGSLWAWGYNDNGQLGGSMDASRNTPTRIGDATDWKSVSAGGSHSAAIKDDGSLWTWGNGGYGQLGIGVTMANGTAVIKRTPTHVEAGTDWVAIEAGAHHVLGIKNDGSLWAWGLNSSGQLGDGTKAIRDIPTRIGSGTDWESVSASDMRSLAIKNDGSLWVWGNNYYGQHDDFVTDKLSTPTRISADTDWKTASVGGIYSLAIKDDGSLWAWGWDMFCKSSAYFGGTVLGRFGLARIGTETDWQSVSAGQWQGHSLAVKDDGTLCAWGWNYYGQLGDGTSTNKSIYTEINDPKPDTIPPVSTSDAVASYAESATVVIAATDAGFAGATVSGVASITYIINGGTPVTVPGDTATVTIPDPGSYILEFWATDVAGNVEFPHNTVMFTVDPVVQPFVGWKDVSGGEYSSLGLKNDGTLWSWGHGGNGQLGNGTSGLDADKTAPTRIGADADWTVISAGNDHSLAIKGDGSLWAWGNNAQGQLGNGTSGAAKTVPIRIEAETDWKAVSAGSWHSLAIKSDGSLWAWGLNMDGQVGDDTTVEKHAPTRIGGDTDWKAVDAGASYSLAIRNDGTLWEWGVIGHEPISDSVRWPVNYVPTRIGDAADWVDISVGRNHALALKSDGSLWAWGYNGYRQLGDSTTQGKAAPIRIGADTDWSSINAGGWGCSFAIKNDGSLWAWGRNDFGQLGDGMAQNKAAPTCIGADVDWQTVNAGGNHSLGIKSDGSLWSWGVNHNGQLGNGTSGYYTTVNIPTLIDGPEFDAVAPVSTSDAVASYAESATVVIAATDLGSADQAASGVREITYTINGGTPVIVPGDMATVTVSDPGSYILEFWATDVAGNVEFPHNTVMFTVDPAEPVVGGEDTCGHVLVKVLDKETRQPVDGAQVGITLGTGLTYTGDTGQLGNQPGEAFFEYVPAGKISIDVAKEGYIMDLSNVPDDARVVAGAVSAYVVYAWRPASGRVHVVDDSGRPISGAEVVLFGIGFPSGVTRVTDGAGQAGFINELSLDSYFVIVSHAFYGMEWGTLVVNTSAEAAETTIVFRLVRTLNVTVKNPNGYPVPNAKVQVQGPAREGIALSDIAGSLKVTTNVGLASFDLSAPGEYAITVSKDGYRTAERVVTYSGSHMNVEVILSGPTGTLQIVCRKENGDGPLVGWQNIRITRTDGEIIGEFWKHAHGIDGALEPIDLPPGTYYVQRESGVGKWYPDPGVLATVVADETTKVTLVASSVPADTTPPVTLSDASVAYINEAVINLFAADAGSGVAATYYRYYPVDAIDSEKGSWVKGTAITVTTPGVYTLEYYSVDNAGNAEIPLAIDFEVIDLSDLDAVAPESTIVGAVDNPTPGSTVTVVITATDTGPAGATVSGVKEIRYKVDGGAEQVVTGSIATVDVTGDGTHTLVFWAVDNTGNVETAKTVSFFIGFESDAIPPVTLCDVNASYIGKAVITLLATDAGSGVASTYYRLNGGTWEKGTIITVTTPGTHILEYYSVDNAGNSEAPHAAVFEVIAVTVGDITPPVSICDAEAIYIDVAVITISAADVGPVGQAVSGIKEIVYILDGGVPVMMSGSTAVVIASGTGIHTLEFWAVDNAGNIESPAGRAVFEVVSFGGTVDKDITAPVSVSDAFPAYASSPAVITLTSADELGGSGMKALYYSVDGGPAQTVTPSTAQIDHNYITTTVSVSGAGDHTIKFWGEDNAGNVEFPIKIADFRIGFMPDTTPPASFSNAGSIFTPAGSTAVIHIMAVDRAEVFGEEVSGVASITYILDGGTPVVTTDVSLVYISVTGDGEHTLEFWATDVAGNVESPTKTASFWIGPVVPDITPPTSASSAFGSYTDEAFIVLTAFDGIDGSGIEGLTYILDGGMPVTVPGGAAQVFVLTFITVSAKGSHTLEFWAVDNSGNEEVPHNFAAFEVISSGGGNDADMPITADVKDKHHSPDHGYPCYSAGSALSTSCATCHTPNATKGLHEGCTDAGCHRVATAPVITPDGLAPVNHAHISSYGCADCHEISGKVPNTSDTVPPMSIADMAASHVGEATIVITAIDVDSADQEVSGVKEITYVLNGGMPVTVPGDVALITVSNVGIHTIEFWAKDNAGNVEAPRNVVTFTVLAADTTLPDRTAPVSVSDAVASYPVGPATVTIVATDPPGAADELVSGIGYIAYRVDGGTTQYLWSDTAAVSVTGDGDHTVEFWAKDNVGNIESPTHVVTFTIGGDTGDGGTGGKDVPGKDVGGKNPSPDDGFFGGETIERISGADRYLTAIEASRKNFDSADAVVLATGANYADALSASALAGALNAPLLLTSPGALSDGILPEVDRLGAAEVWIIGSDKAISTAVETSLKSVGLEVERIAGADRYATSAGIASKVAELEGAAFTKKAFLARGDNFADGLAVSPLAYSNKIPVLLTRPNVLPDDTANAITALGIKDVTILGSSSAVTVVVEDSIGCLVSATRRVGGADRYKTAEEIAKHAFAQGLASKDFVGVSTGLNFPDALAGGVATGERGGILILTDPKTLSSNWASYLPGAYAGIKPDIQLYGDPSVLDSRVMESLQTVLLGN
ncbi:MAG: cell wall-binding repeat-containing protein [Coriobacteriia bacterium]|nr:cell wall-binding repeat-containing protein [Coriobacteriia bacterium]